jgi:energy-coupling factor transporter ATP-binding protein EcfA2
MKLDTIYARFFRSLNFDYIRQSSPEYAPDPWDATSPTGADYPFVRVRLEPDITTIVGGNESGKTQMLDAVEAALTGVGFDRSDFCRYSPFFSVDKTLVDPEFGARFRDISPEDVAGIEKMCGFKDLHDVDRVALFRMNETPKLRLYVRQAGEWLPPKHVQTPTMLSELGIPAIYKIDAGVPLPDSVPLEFLATGKPTSAVGRHLLRDVWDKFSSNKKWFESNTSVSAAATDIAAAFKPTGTLDDDELAKFKLAADLLIKVAGLDPSLFQELRKAVRNQNGYANSIVDTINGELAKSLNFPHWWSQDSRFELFVSLYEFDLVFMIRDRTGRSYGFDERSSGLKYFLSYFVQYLAHEERADGQPEILLMDEPDAYLSSSGQQDLLRIFASFAVPDDDARLPVQVVYVTHSPFLIDKNHAERIRVLEKGEHDEGTRVVASAAQNHYEPLRSAFGSFVGETTFIGTCNLMLEGPSDQILLAGISGWLGRRRVPELERLDLNSLTLVPAGSASQVPYLVYLARGRDVERPPVVVLLDGDSAGDEARATIARGGARRKALVSEDLVLQLTDGVFDGLTTDNPSGRLVIEDLIPLDLAIEAAGLYCQEFVPDVDVAALVLTEKGVFTQGTGKSLLIELERAITAASGEASFHLDKVGFARSVLTVLKGRPAEDKSLGVVEANFRLLLAELGKRQRQAVKDESTEKVSSRIKRARQRFLRIHAGKARREHVLLLIEEISGQLDNSFEAEDVRFAMRGWHERFKLDEDPRLDVDDFDGVVAAIESLAYLGARNSAGLGSSRGDTP